ncbi:MAG: hypothetical protein PVH00_05285 [Gemmatimonadota bacterium]|jgi:hypothetical protein
MLDNIFGLAFLYWLVRAAVVLYCLWLATRFVQALESIADRMDRRTT